MHWNTLSLLGFIAVVACEPTSAQTAGPTFHCGKVQAEVERLICDDAALASLDRKLDAVYRSALAKSRGPLAVLLRQEQRGWAKGRNDCWKANGQTTWITATWTVNTVRSCVDAQYRLRIAELQAVWRLMPPRSVIYACQNEAANEVVVNFFDTDPATLRLEHGDRSTTLWRVGGVVAGKYEGNNVSVVHQGDGLALSRLDTNTGKTDDLQCKPASLQVPPLVAK